MNKRSLSFFVKRSVPPDTTQIPTNWYIKFHTPPGGSLSQIPTGPETAAVLQNVFGSWRENSTLLTALGAVTINQPQMVMLLDVFDYCRENEHSCDLATTSCVFQAATAEISCMCLPFHIPLLLGEDLNGKKCIFDKNGTAVFLTRNGQEQSRLWIALYVFMGICALALIGLVLTILLLKTRPVKTRTKVKRNGQLPRVSVSHYPNKLPRPKLVVTELERIARESQLRPPSLMVLNNASPAGSPSKSTTLQNATRSESPVPPPAPPVMVVHHNYATPSTSTASPMSIVNSNIHPQMAPPTAQELGTFKRRPRLNNNNNEGSPNKANQTRHSRLPPLASSESSIELPRLSRSSVGEQSGTNTPNASRPGSGLIFTRSMNGGEREGALSPEGMIYSVQDSTALYRAIQQHRHSALLNLIHGSQGAPQSNV